MLFVVPTPIGNSDDVTLRALKLLASTDLIITENTGTTKKFLSIHRIDYTQKVFMKFTSYDHFSINTILSKLKNQDAILVSEAGTPALSDPGKVLIQAVIDAELSLSILPGATALIPAVVAANFPTLHWTFYGFLPHKNGREKLLTLMINSHHASFFYESVHRISKLMQQLEKLKFHGKISIAREISKLHEQLITGDIALITEKLHTNQIPHRGEFVIGLYPQK